MADVATVLCWVFFHAVSSTDAVDILKEMKEKDLAMDGSHVNTFCHSLHMLASAGDSAAIKKMQNTVFTLGLAKPSYQLCSPLITSYLKR